MTIQFKQVSKKEVSLPQNFESKVSTENKNKLLFFKVISYFKGNRSLNSSLQDIKHKTYPYPALTKMYFDKTGIHYTGLPTKDEILKTNLQNLMSFFTSIHVFLQLQTS